MASRALYGDAVAAAAQGLGDGGVGAGAIEDDVCGNAAGQCALVIEMAHTAQIALALLAHIAHKEEGCGDFGFCLDERVGDGQHSHHPSGVVAGARSTEAVALDHRIERGIGGKDGVEVR